jgi:cyclase
LGAEKVAVGAGIFRSPNLVEEIAAQIGNQSMVAVLDVRKKRFRAAYEVFIQNGKEGTGRCPIELAKDLQARGAGEILVNSIDNDGMMEGYDISLAQKVREATTLPLINIGGAGGTQDIVNLFKETRYTAAAAGSLFVYKGKFKAVLINYRTFCT